MRALITGATRGIGRACAEVLAGEGYAVTAVARSREGLEKMQASWTLPGYGRLTCLALDLERELPPATDYDVVILNAARYLPGRLLATDRNVFAELWPLNVAANQQLANRLLPAMVSRGRGHLVVIGSTATDDTSPHMTAYAATKRALRGLFAGWAQELAGSGVRCTLVAPGATLTSSWEGEEIPEKILRAEEVAAVVAAAIREGREGRLVIKAG